MDKKFVLSSFFRGFSRVAGIQTNRRSLRSDDKSDLEIALNNFTDVVESVNSKK